jgi:hypothetical protein
MNGDWHIRLKRRADQKNPVEIFFRDMLRHDPASNQQCRVVRFSSRPLLDSSLRSIGVVSRSLEQGKAQIKHFGEHQDILLASEDAWHGTHSLPAAPGLQSHSKNLSERWYKSEGYCQMIAKSKTFAIVSTLLIISNVVWIGIDVQFNTAAHTLAASAAFQVPEHCFCAWFIFDIGIRFAALRMKMQCLKDSWFCFDAALVALIVLDTWLLPLVWLEDRQVRRVGLLRVVRVLRLSLLMRLLKFSEALILLHGIAAALRSVTGTFVMLLMLIYTFGVICQTLAKDHPDLPHQFHSVAGCMKYLLLQGTFIDDVTIFLDDVYPISPSIFFVFLTFMFLSGLVVLKLLTGLLVDVVKRVREIEEKRVNVFQLRESLFEILSVHDRDDDMLLWPEEWDLIVSNPELKSILQRSHVSLDALKEMKQVLYPSFVMSSSENQRKGITYEDFLRAVLSLRGDATATVKNVVDLRQFIQEKLDNLHMQMIARGALNVPTDDVVFSNDVNAQLPPWGQEILSRIRDLTAKYDQTSQELNDLRREIFRRSFDSVSSARLTSSPTPPIEPSDQPALLPCHVRDSDPGLSTLLPCQVDDSNGQSLDRRACVNVS